MSKHQPPAIQFAPLKSSQIAGHLLDGREHLAFPDGLELRA